MGAKRQPSPTSAPGKGSCKRTFSVKQVRRVDDCVDRVHGSVSLRSPRGLSALRARTSLPARGGPDHSVDGRDVRACAGAVAYVERGPAERHFAGSEVVLLFGLFGCGSRVKRRGRAFKRRVARLALRCKRFGCAGGVRGSERLSRRRALRVAGPNHEGLASTVLRSRRDQGFRCRNQLTVYFDC